MKVCDDFEPCSVTCGGGTQTCQNECENGDFGEKGCPEEEKTNTQTCNEQECRKLNKLHNYIHNVLKVIKNGVKLSWSPVATLENVRKLVAEELKQEVVRAQTLLLPTVVVNAPDHLLNQDSVTFVLVSHYFLQGSTN